MSCCETPKHGAAAGDGYRYTSPADAVAAMIGCAARVKIERLPLAEASGRILASAIVTDRPSPALNVSAMDGFAMRAADAGMIELSVVGEARIGQAPTAAKLPAGSAMRIVTGAPMTPGTDCVIKREDVEEGEGAIRPRAAGAATLRPGTHVRRRGENAGAGQVVVPAGVELSASAIAAAASFGASTVEVFRRVRVAVIVTGDELVSVSETPEEWQIRDSNGPAIAAMLACRPWLEALPAVRAADDPERLRTTLAAALESADAVLLTGGASMGHRDFVPRVVGELGARTLFHKLPQRPGKPILGAIMPDGRPVLGLPGNPVSVMVTARRFAVSVLAHMAGLTRPVGAESVVSLDGAHEAIADLWWHRLVRLGEPGRAEAVAGRGSGDVAAAAQSDGFIEIPPGAMAAGPWPFYGWVW